MTVCFHFGKVSLVDKGDVLAVLEKDGDGRRIEWIMEGKVPSECIELMVEMWKND